MDLHALIRSKDYDFLRDHPRLGERIMILGPGGSYAYGTNNENSDIDIRGITLNTPSDLLTRWSAFFWSAIPTPARSWGWMERII